jgi:hypothetical protein
MRLTSLRKATKTTTAPGPRTRTVAQVMASNAVIAVSRT